MTSLGKLLLVAALTEDALLLKDKHGVLQLFVTTGADKVLRVPGATHGCGKGSSGGREGGREREGGLGIDFYTEVWFSDLCMCVCLMQASHQVFQDPG